ncbi:MAG: hypothetical protein ABI602_02980 [Candidatus Saccharibacteria bacterium]
MEIKGHGIEVYLNLAKLPDEQLLAMADEINLEVNDRGLVLAAVAGTLALEGVRQDEPIVNLKEFISNNLVTALGGYSEVVDLLNYDRTASNVIKPASAEILETEFNDWLTYSKLNYVRTTQEADPDLHYTLVATPNITASRAEIRQAAVFGPDQASETSFDAELLLHYSPQQLSGTNPENGKAFMFSLVPNTCYVALRDTVPRQLEKLQSLQMLTPGLKVPSRLETITWWATLSAQADDLNHGDVYDRTAVRHFDLPAHKIDRNWCVPHSYVDDRGEVHLSLSDAESINDGRIALG